MAEIDVISIGSAVVIGESIKATVVGVWIRPRNHVVYEVVWWSDNARQTAWVERIEIHEDQNFREIKVGFIQLGE